MREKAILVRLTKEEFDGIQNEARKLGLSVASFIRLLVKQWSNGIKFEKGRKQ